MKYDNVPWRPVAWVVSTLGLLGTVAAVSYVSHDFGYGTPMLERPIGLLVGLLMASAVFWFIAVGAAYNTLCNARILTGIFVVGVLLRLCYFGSTPVLEDDFYRYLWDGGVTGHGHNPYRYIPQDVLLREETVPADLVSLADSAGPILDRVNHGQLSTVYPPVAQAVFTTAHLLAAWSLNALRAVYLAIDCFAFLVLVALLGRLMQPKALALVYWWNPLLIEEFYNSAHMDLILVPLLLMALWFSLDGKPVGVMVALAMAVGAKVWPVLLAPLFLWPHRRDAERFAQAVAAFAILTALWYLAVQPGLAHGNASGFIAYGERWEMNDALFMVFPWTAKHVLPWFGYEVSDALAHAIGRVSVALIVGLIALYLAFFRNKTEESRARSALIIVAALFILSPTEFPWYYGWVVPFLALFPSPALMTHTLLLPLYYLKFYYDAIGEVDFFHYRVVWIEHSPIWIALIIERWWVWRKRKRRD